jgi:HlyD family secretion protein
MTADAATLPATQAAAGARTPVAARAAGAGGGLPALARPLPPPTPPVAIETAPRPRTRGSVAFGVIAILLFFGGFAAWSVLAPLSEAAIAPGVIKVEGQRRTIQHLEGGIVREILVKDGDRVEAGQVLMRLDDVQSGANLETLRSQRWSLLAQDARLMAELARAREIAFPPDLLAAAEPRARDAVAGQRALFEARTVSLDSQLDVLRKRVEQQQAVAASAEGQLNSQREQLALIRREEATVRDLLRQGLERMPRLLQLQRTAASLEGNITDVRGQIERARATIAEAQSQMRQIEDQRLQEVSAELREVRTKLAETEERLRAAADVATRREITAPEAGTVLNLRVFNLGAVIRPGDPAMDLVPEKDRLIAEVTVQPGDIDAVYPGLRAEVRLPAFKQRLVPYLHGNVTFVASDVTVDERTRANYYRANILIDGDQLESLPNVKLVPGMPVEAYVLIGERSFLRYIIQPVLDSFHRAFREQ